MTTTRTLPDTLEPPAEEVPTRPAPVVEQTGGWAGQWALQSLLGRPGAEGRVPGLDGIRAFAVLAVILYHCGIGWIPGGFYGVDAFFVLSGFLITALLVRESAATGRIALGGFWARRARRLLPALLLMLTAVSVIAAVRPAVLSTPTLLSDELSTLLYVSNWHFAAGHVNYFTASAAPSPLLHTWTLGIEEQYYLLWPLVVMAVLGRRGQAWRSAAQRRRRLTTLLVVALAGAGASAARMMLATPVHGDVTRSYYGTDTRAQALLLGAACAVALALMGRRWQRDLGPLFVLAGLLGAAVIGLVWTGLRYNAPFAFHGGFLVMAVAACAVTVSAACVEEGLLAGILSWGPLQWIGRISYGMYLWYWPTLLVLTGSRTHLEGAGLAAVRVWVTVALAAVSYHALELPIRRRRLAAHLRPARAAAGVGTVALAGVVAVAPTAVAATVHQHAPLPVTAPAVVTGPPVRVMVVGDSMAGTLAMGLQQVAGHYGAEIVNEGTPSCSVSAEGDYFIRGQVVPPLWPCIPGAPQDLFAQWQRWLAQFDPDVVVYLARGETFGVQLNGQWTDVGQPIDAAWVASRLQQAVSVLGSLGAKVVLLTTPAYASGEQPDGAPWPEDRRDRLDRVNAIIRDVAAHTPGVGFFDAGAMLSPGDTYTATLDSTPIRCNDGIHLQETGGEYLGTKLLPYLVGLGHARAVAVTPKRAPLGTIPPPGWWPSLQAICSD